MSSYLAKHESKEASYRDIVNAKEFVVSEVKIWEAGSSFLATHNLVKLEVTLQETVILAHVGYWSAGSDYNTRIVGRDSGLWAYIEALWLAHTGSGDLVPFLSKLTEEVEKLLIWVSR